MLDLYILMGANGSGKSTTGAIYLPAHVQKKQEVFDGDKFYWNKIRELYKLQTPSIKEAKRLALDMLFNTLTDL
jgi:predicted ABC-type ATPase